MEVGGEGDYIPIATQFIMDLDIQVHEFIVLMPRTTTLLRLRPL